MWLDWIGVIYLTLVVLSFLLVQGHYVTIYLNPSLQLEVVYKLSSGSRNRN